MQDREAMIYMYSSSTAIRALVVEPDDTARRLVSEALRDGGWEVSDCVDWNHGKELYHGQRLVVTPLEGWRDDVREFVSWVRARTGAAQPWIIATVRNGSVDFAESADRFGVNDIVTDPLDAVRLAQRLGMAECGAGPDSRNACWERALGRVLGEGSAAAVAVLDRELRFLYMNPRWRSEFQIPEGVGAGSQYRDLFPDAHPAWLQIYANCLNGRGSRILEDVIERSNGAEECVRWEVEPWRSGDEIGGLILICRVADGRRPDVDSSVVREEDAGPADMTLGDFRAIAEAAPFGMMLLNDDAEVVYANPQHRTVLGFSVSECGGLDGWLARGRVADGDFQEKAIAEWWERVWRRRAPWVFTMRSAEGILKEVEFRPSPLPGNRLLLTIFDVTDARLEEQAIRASETRYRSLFQECSTPMALINPTGHISEVNPAFERLTGCSRREARRAGLSEFLSPDALDIFRMHAVGASPRREVETGVRTQDGRVVPARVNVALLPCGTTGVSYAVCSIQPVGALPASAVPSAPPFPGLPDTPDGVVILDAQGRVLDHRDSSDAPGLLARSGSGTVPFEAGFPHLAERIPVAEMIIRASASPGKPVRIAVRLPLSAADPGPTAGFEVRVTQLAHPGVPAPPRFALVLRSLPPEVTIPGQPH